jgi:hypothetical protein
MTKQAIIVVLALAACGGKKDKGGGQTATIDAAGVNALVPAALKDKLVFEKRDAVIEQGRDKTTYTMAIPKTWTQEGKMFAHFKGDKDAGFFTALRVGSNCDGECTPKEWEKVADKVNFAPLAKGKVLKDNKGAGTRTMVAEVESGGAKLTTVVVAWWTEGASKYYACTAELDEAIKDAAPAFEKACSAVNIDGRD